MTVLLHSFDLLCVLRTFLAEVVKVGALILCFPALACNSTRHLFRRSTDYQTLGASVLSNG